MLDGIDVGLLEYNPDKAREIMSSLGYGPNNLLTVNLMTANTGESTAVSEAVQGMANECYFDVLFTIVDGITEEVNSRDFPSSWDGAISQAQFYTDAEIYFSDSDAFGKQPGEYSGFKANDDPEFARLFRLLPVTEDPVARDKIVDQLNLLYQENLYLIPILISSQPTLVQNYLKNVVFRDGLGIIWKDIQYKEWVDYTP